MKNLKFIGIIVGVFLIYLGIKHNKFNWQQIFELPFVVGFFLVVLIFIFSLKKKK